MDWLDYQQIYIVLELLLAVILGGIIGFEREHVGKAAGIRTFALVSLGAALFTIVTREAHVLFRDLPNIDYDPSRIAANIVIGIGFIGAGMIIFRRRKNAVIGLTTAAGLWVSGAIGMAVGFRFYLIAIFVTLIDVLILVGLSGIRKIVKQKYVKRRPR